MAYNRIILGNPRCLMIAQFWETLDGLSLHNPGKPKMVFDCTILGNPGWLIIAQSWETEDDCTIRLLHIVIEIKVPAPLFAHYTFFKQNWETFYMGLYKEFCIPCPTLLTLPHDLLSLPNMFSSCPMFCSPLPHKLLILAGMV